MRNILFLVVKLINNKWLIYVSWLFVFVHTTRSYDSCIITYTQFENDGRVTFQQKFQPRCKKETIIARKYHNKIIYNSYLLLFRFLFKSRYLLIRVAEMTRLYRAK